MRNDKEKTAVDMRPTVISTFAGGGGSSLGYRMVGFRELLAIDFDAHACGVFRLNFPEVPCWQRDIRTVTAEEILQFCGMQKGELDILDGSPPCQGFSTAGKRKVSDERNDLFREYVRLIEGLEPKVFIMENVTGMVKGRMRGRFIEIMRTLKALPYNIECRKLNAMWYGVPQSRERLFWIGVRKSIKKKPIWPKRNNKVVTFKDAINKLVLKKKEIKEAKKEANRSHIKHYYLLMRPGESAAKYAQGKAFNCVRLRFDRSCKTIIKANRGFTIWLRPDEDRALTISETKRVCSFPDNFKLIGKYNKKHEILGNAVMPLQMKAIAETIKREILT